MSDDDFRPRVLVTKIGLDGHDRGSRIVAAACRDAGMEVIYTPPWQSIPAVVKLALEEGVDVVGISSLATDHLIVPRLMTALREAGLGNVRVVVGGIVPDNEEKLLIDAGVREVFHPGSTMDDITRRMREYAREARRAAASAGHSGGSRRRQHHRRFVGRLLLEWPHLLVGARSRHGHPGVDAERTAVGERDCRGEAGAFR